LVSPSSAPQIVGATFSAPALGNGAFFYPEPMTTPNPKSSILGRYLATLLGIVAAAELYGQAAPAPSPETLAKYDKNKNGILDPDELAQKASDEKDAAILMNPFTVSTDKDVGYTAGNTLSGGRVDTPLAITPGSISVMTKEFMDDFNITDYEPSRKLEHRLRLGHVGAKLRSQLDQCVSKHRPRCALGG
jgi:hypothetical protein